jgi:septum formation protein
MTALWRARLPLVLASQSRARRELLACAGIPFEAVAAAIDERGLEAQLVAAGAGPGEVALRLSKAKALVISAKMPGRLIVGADQVLWLEGQMFGKAADRAAAVSQLQKMSGRTHELHSGCCVVCDGRSAFETVAVARLRCRVLSSRFIETYLSQAGCLDNAGTYRIEGLGVHLFDSIEGDHWTILGLPVLPLFSFLRKEGWLLA